MQESKWTTITGTEIKNCRGVASLKGIGKSRDDRVKNIESSGEESNVSSEDPAPKSRIPGEIVKFKQLDTNGLPPDSSEARKLIQWGKTAPQVLVARCLM